MDYDVVVIGAGNGGLTASLTLANKGLNVLLLERHNIPGGAATSFCRGRFEFEIALHQLSGFGRPEQPGPVRMLFEGLGIMDRLEMVESPDLFSLCTRDGLNISLKPDRAQVVAALSEHFPNERAGIEKFLQLCYDYSTQMISAFVFKDPEVTREKYPILFSHAYKPAIEVLDELFTDPLLKAIIAVYWGYLGVPPTRLTFAYLALIYFSYIELKSYHVKGGSQALSNAIADRFMEQGGQVRYNCAVDKIIVENGQVKGVVTEHGEKIGCRFVVSNASQVLTYIQMVGPEYTPPGVLEEMRGRSLSPSAFTLYMGLDCEPEDVGIKDATYFMLGSTDISDGIIDRMRRLKVDDEILVMSCYDVADPDFSPPGACQLNVVTLKYGDTWLRVPPHEYHRVKFEQGENMLKRVEEIFPGVRSHIEEMEVATPLTHMRYLGHPNGSIYGWDQQTKDSAFLQPARRSPLGGLYFASGWAGDCGFQPTLESGASAARSLLKEWAK